MDGWTLLEKPPKIEPKPVFIVAGKEYFLRSLLCDILEKQILPEEAEMARSVFDGETIDWASVKDDLQTPPFGSRIRFVLIKEADDFITKQRERLEKYLTSPSPCGVLVLECTSWKSNTKLAKAIPDAQTLMCEPKKPAALTSFLTKWCQTKHQKKIAGDAVNMLLEQVEPDLGLLDQELAKLSVYVGEKETITVKDVDVLVARNRSSTVWGMLDALAAGQPGPAFLTLQRLVEQGEDPHGLFAGMAWQVRKMGQAHRLLQDGISLQGAIAQSGLPPFKAQSVQQHLRTLGPRADKLYDWLMESETALKSSGQLTPVAILERLLVRLT
ncbi:MAG: DNA polymerase III subunit delta [Gemmatales bacterium]